MPAGAVRYASRSGPLGQQERSAIYASDSKRIILRVLRRGANTSTSHLSDSLSCKSASLGLSK